MSPSRILFLGDSTSPLAAWLAEHGETVICTTGKLTTAWASSQRCEWLVSYGYRHIVRNDVLALFPERAINLHISLLPWNRGADPNFWSFVDNTPKGVTIHLMDAGVDTGDILVQQTVTLSGENETLASTYHQLQTTIQRLFRKSWFDIKSGGVPRRSQPPGGSVHRVKDKEPLLHLLDDGWDTPVSKLIGIR